MVTRHHALKQAVYGRKLEVMDEMLSAWIGDLNLGVLGVVHLDE
jgi:hypothetical protein